MDKRLYTLFGYKVSSQIELNAYVANDDEIPVDVEIIVHNNSKSNMIEDGFFIEDHSLTHNVFNVPDIAKYVIDNGNRIEIYPHEKATLEDIKLFLLGTAFGLMMHQRGVFPLHGSSIDVGNHCIIVVGHSGAGKTSLASAFVDQGYKLLSDDVSRYDIRENEIVVYPSYPSQKIWKDSLEALSLEYDDTNKIRIADEKYYVDNEDRFTDQSKPLLAIIEIMPCEIDEPELCRMGLKESLTLSLVHSYRQEVMTTSSPLSGHFQSCVTLVKRVPIYSLKRPANRFTLSEQVKLIIDEVNKYQ